MLYRDLTITRRWAAFSRDRRHRYVLGREFQTAQGDLLSGWAAVQPGTCVWLMLNPSLADGRGDDPTLRRCLAFTASWGFRRLEVVNLFTCVSPRPEQIRADGAPNGPRADKELRSALRRAALVVVAWGAHGGYQGRDAAIVRHLRRLACPVMCLGRTLQGHPRHPLYLDGQALPEPFPLSEPDSR
jgi:hypothetical protein